MQSTNLFIKKGAILAYRQYDIAHEIDLKKILALWETEPNKVIRRYQLNKDPFRTVVMREAPLTLSGGEENLGIKLKDNLQDLPAAVEVKIWGYGVISFSYKIAIPENLEWKDLVLLGSLLDSDSVIDDLSVKKRDDLFTRLRDINCLKKPEINDTFEDYTTYLIEEIEERTKSKTEGEPDQIKKIKDPQELLKKHCIAELLLAEPSRTLSDSTRKSIQSSFSQYTNKDMILLDWNTALIVDFTKEKDHVDYIDLIEFSLAQLLELRIYDERLDEQLDQLYDSLEKKQFDSITNVYSAMSEEAGRLYMEFSDFFEKLDNSIKTVGDYYLAKILRNADKRFGYDELKRNMYRKIEALRDLSTMYQDKVETLIDSQRNATAHRMELIVIALISVEVFPSVYHHLPEIINFINKLFSWVQGLF